MRSQLRCFLILLTVTLVAPCRAVEGAPARRPAGGPAGRQLPARAGGSIFRGPLRVLAENPRYFTDDSGTAIYLTGSHTWLDFQDRIDGGRPRVNFTSYLNLLEKYNHDFIRLWIWEDARHVPLPFRRTGPGLAQDGNPKFDLSQFNPEFFNRLRSRVLQAAARGLYVSVMLFQGWSVESRSNDRQPWPLHPFNRHNNVNGVDGDRNGNGEGEEVHTLALPAITEIQRRYVAKVIDTLSDLNNVLWEISNESHARSTNWQYDFIDYIREGESRRSKPHPVGMTLQYGGDAGALFDSPADWISPGSVKPSTALRYRINPPPSTGAKVIIADTDHLFLRGESPDAAWVWKSFTRGYNPIFMDVVEEPRWDEVRQAMGDTRRFATRMTLTSMEPRGDLASTGYCLASRSADHPEFLVFVPRDGGRLEPVIQWLPHSIESWVRANNPLHLEVTVDLSTVAAPIAVEWFNPATGETMSRPDVQGGSRRTFTAPFSGDAVLFLRANS